MGIQIDIKPDKIGLRYPVEIGLVGDSKLVLSALIPLLLKIIIIMNFYIQNKME